MIFHKAVKSVLNKHKNRDTWFLDEYSVNPYEGCGFNCLYCYVRGSHYGEHFSGIITVKDNATDILDKQLAARAKKGAYGIIALGSATDAYMQVEEELQQTRKILEVILKNRFPVFISTKSTLIQRDIDLLQQIDKKAILPGDLQVKLKRGAVISFSLSTLDEKISTLLEPGAPTPLQRLETMKAVCDAGLLTGLNALPLLPFLSDTDEALAAIAQSAKEYGAAYLLAGGLTLFGDQPGDSKALYYRFLQQYYPGLLPKYKEMYGNNFYQSWSYQSVLKKKTGKWCSAYGLRTSII